MPLYTENDLWNMEEPARNFADMPRWIDPGFTVQDAMAVHQGGCASGAYMPAVTYHQANDTMHTYGNEVLEYLEEFLDVLPAIPEGLSWGQMASHYLAYAVDLWAFSFVEDMLETEAA